MLSASSNNNNESPVLGIPKVMTFRWQQLFELTKMQQEKTIQRLGRDDANHDEAEPSMSMERRLMVPPNACDWFLRISQLQNSSSLGDGDDSQNSSSSSSSGDSATPFVADFICQGVIPPPSCGAFLDLLSEQAAAMPSLGTTFSARIDDRCSLKLCVFRKGVVITVAFRNRKSGKSEIFMAPDPSKSVVLSTYMELPAEGGEE